MIIKSHIRGGFRAAATYLREQGKNEKTRLVEISDRALQTLDEAFQSMWCVAGGTKARKPLHHISINPMKDERLSDEQVMKIVARCEEVYGYKHEEHQRVIVEHIKDGRQHFHVMWNRVSLATGRAVWPGHHWNKSRQVAREMEQELGLRRPETRRKRRARSMAGYSGKTTSRKTNRYAAVKAGAAQSHTTRTKDGARDGSWLPAMVNPLATKHVAPSPEPQNSSSMPLRPDTYREGWPLAAIIDWKTWGYKHPRRFFQVWWELAK